MKLGQTLLQVTAPSERTLKERVALYLAEGWNRFGGVCLKWELGTAEQEPVFIYYQVMVTLEAWDEPTN